MWHRSMMLAILLLGLAISVKARTCMPDAVPENQRSNITVGGISMPLVVWYPQWASGQTSAYVFSILAGDVLGYHMSEDRARSGSSSQEMILCIGWLPRSSGLRNRPEMWNWRAGDKARWF
ncbi:unnamed protein product [Polarella glacialis]|uniref:Uncharacterized protein n=1 Tax=Polarella glacialis TaxID=89957 RepID=A0A813JG35_POLGL|nr:unnamed protein product [Polarella glacialis]